MPNTTNQFRALLQVLLFGAGHFTVDGSGLNRWEKVETGTDTHNGAFVAKALRTVKRCRWRWFRQWTLPGRSRRGEARGRLSAQNND